MKIVAFSDTHAHHREVTLPDGDVLVFGGDLMTCGRKMNEVIGFADWFMKQPHEYKILIAGNHDRLFESQQRLCLDEFLTRESNPPGREFHYLRDSGCEIEGIKFWGSPYQPWFYDWAFNVHRGPAIKKYWDKIPEGTDVLITHGPPKGYGDQTIGWGGDRVGCEELSIAVQVIRPRVHIFGHIHNGYGVYETPNTNFHNVSICNEEYEAVHEPHQIYIER